MSHEPSFHSADEAPFASPDVAQRRYMTVLFADIANSTGIAAGMDAEDFAELLGKVRQVLDRVIPRHGGMLVRIDGDGAAVLFGHPDPHEDDGRRATEAALELRDAMREIGGPELGQGAVKLHIGIHSGLVLLNPGDIVRGRFEMLGDATNVASRLASKANGSEILVSEETLGPHLMHFRTGPRRLMRLKGKAMPVATYRIIRRDPSDFCFSNRLTPFIGRTVEREKLACALDDLAEGKGGLLRIIGAPGVGKTRLAHYFIDTATSAGVTVHRGYCEAYLGAEPLQPFLQILRSILGMRASETKIRLVAAARKNLLAIDARLADLWPDVARLLSLGPARREAGTAWNPTEDKRLSAAVTLFRRLTERSPIILFIDDWQSADEASREMLSALHAANLSGLLILLSERAHPLADRNEMPTATLRLEPFTPEEVGAAVRALSPATDPFVIARIVDRSGGIPLFVEELCHSLAYDERGRARPGGPAWLESLIQARCARLPAEQAQLVRMAAVIGNMVPSWLLEKLTGHTAGDLIVDSLSGHDFIHESDMPGILRFKHGITRDVIYEAVGRRERTELHLKIAGHLAAFGAAHGIEDQYAPLAYHYQAGGDFEQGADFAELAGDRAAAVSALDRAQAQYRAALDCLDKLPISSSVLDRTTQLLRSYGLASRFDPSRQQLAVFLRARESAMSRKDRVGAAWANYWLGCLYYALGEPRAAIAHSDLALTWSKETTITANFDNNIKAILGRSLAAACDYDAALPLLEETIEAKRHQMDEAHAPVTLVYSLACKGFILADMGDFDGAHRCYVEADAHVSGRDHEVRSSVLSRRSAICVWQGRMEEALEFAHQAEMVAARVKARYAYMMSRALAGFAQWSLDRNPLALQVLIDATEWLGASDRGQFTSMNYGWLATAMVETGESAKAKHYAARAMMRVRKWDRLGEAMACRAMARAAAAAGNWQAADRYIRRALASAAFRHSGHDLAKIQLCQAELAVHAGNRAGATSALEAAATELVRMDMPLHTAKADRLAGVLRSTGLS
ncbi:hypothetical protein ACFB49_08150 [Sphingomonas sp. DBB INV C78]|uniref:ATP-binding protein n=1 Tax=Sphingomonas sp. DBB INV C78 TaxID=3349434 RepID=UPI0036D26B6B